jgi:post-segregation antitoxin (ccd killing protein)
MGRLKKITVQVPEDLLRRARKDGEGITATVREALEIRARKQAYEQLRALRGKVKWSVSLEDLRKDD